MPGRTFLQSEKYTPRYDIFWRFVVGLLRGEHVISFFDTMEAYQMDLLGPTHQRIVIHCLDEAVSSLQSRIEREWKVAYRNGYCLSAVSENQHHWQVSPNFQTLHSTMLSKSALAKRESRF
jgi:hypothetical protein